MSRMSEKFRDDFDKGPGELQQEIDSTRSHMEQTLDLLERKLSPGQIIDEVLRMARGNGEGFAHNLTAQIQNNPMPTLLTGVGLLWLISASKRPPSAQPSRHDGTGLAHDTVAQAREGVEGIADRARGAAKQAQEGAHAWGERAQEAGQRVSDGAAQARSHMHEMADSARGGSAYAGQAARESMRRAQGEYQRLLHEQPLLLGGLGIALGAALGALVPRSEAEDELMGEYGERFREEAGQEGRKQYQRARDTAERAAGAAREEVSGERQPGSQGGSAHHH